MEKIKLTKKDIKKLLLTFCEQQNECDHCPAMDSILGECPIFLHDKYKVKVVKNAE